MIRKSLSKTGAFFIISMVSGTISAAPGSVHAKTDGGGYAHAKSPPQNLKEAYKRPLRISANTLPKIVQEAIKYHPSIAADQEALSASSDVIDQAEAGYAPTVDLRASLGREKIERKFAANSLTPLPSAGSLTTTRSDPSVNIRQILFDGMGTTARVARAHSQRRQAHGTLGVTTDTAMIDAASATLDIRRLQRLLRIVNKNIKFHQAMKEKIEQIVQAGAAPISDLFQIESRLQDTYVSKSNIQSDLEVAQAKFIEVVGKEPPHEIQKVQLPGYLTSMSLEMAVRMALDNNNSIKIAQSNVQIAEANQLETGSKLVPTITVEVEGERNRNTSGTSGFQNRVTAMVVARHNLFNGGADFARSRETTKRLTEAHARLNLARRQTERTIRTAWAEAKNARAKSAHLTHLIREKRRILSSYLREFSLAKRTLLDILDAANDVFLTEATRTSVDATTDINTIVLSVGTSQFKGYLNRASESEETGHKNKSDPMADLPDLDPSLHLASLDGRKVKLLKRKDFFDRKKESRQNALVDKVNA